MKKTFRVFITMLLCFSLFTALSSVVSAKSVDEIAAAVKSAGIKDEKFAAAVADALAEEGLTDDSYYENDATTRALLAEFNGAIDARKKGIVSIEGINLLLGAGEVDLRENRIEDLTPMHLDLPAVYSGTFDFRDNPVSNYPVSVQTNTDSVEWFSTNDNSCNFYKGCDFRSDIRLLYSKDGNDITIYFGVTEGGEYCWSTDGEELILPKVTNYTGSMNESNTTWVYDYSGGKAAETSSYGTASVTESGSFTVRAPYEYYRWAARYKENNYSPEKPFTDYSSPDRSSPEYFYTVGVDYYSPVRQDTTTVLLGGVKVTKTDVNESPLSGAKFGIYYDKGCTDPAGEEKTTDANGVVVWSELPEGKYFVKELVAPNGYEITGDGVYEVDVDCGDISWNTAIEGGSDIGGYYEGDVALEPDWQYWTKGSGVKPMRVKSGKFTTQAEGEVLIKNGGDGLTKLAQEFDDSDLTLVSSTLVVKKNANDVGTSVDTVKDAKDVINGWISGGLLTSDYSDISITGTVTYGCAEEDFATLTVEDKSLCVYFEPVANKKLVGLPIEGGMFKFVICDEEGETLFEGVNLEASADEDTTDVKFFDFDGHTAFFRFCSEAAGKTFTYTIKEVVKDEDKIEGVSYDEDERTMTVEVSETGTRGLAVKITVKKGDSVESETTLYSDQMNYDEEGNIVDFGTVDLCTIINRFTARPNPTTGVPTLFSLVDLLTVAGVGILLKKRFF